MQNMIICICIAQLGGRELGGRFGIIWHVCYYRLEALTWV